MRMRLESDIANCRDELIRAAADAGSHIETQAKEDAAAEARRELERQLAEWRDAATREAEERERDIEVRLRQAEAREQDAEARERDADTRRQEAEARLQIVERSLEELRRSSEDERLHKEREIEIARQELEGARQEAQDTRLQLETTRDEVEASRGEIEQRLAEMQRVEDGMRAANDSLAQAARLPHAIEQLDQADSLGEALDGLVRCAAAEADRAIIFLMKGRRLHDWRSVGFDGLTDRVEIGVDEPGPFAAASQGERGLCRGSQLPAFAAGSDSRYGVTLPVRVGGAVVAVLYADGPDADKDTEPIWLSRLDVLARYAGRMLESITIRQAAGLSAVSHRRSSAVASHPPAGSVQ